jgi:sortase (surface protein transpeptidase)
LSIAFAILCLSPSSSTPIANLRNIVQVPLKPSSTGTIAITGRPIRLVIPGSSIDIPVDEGYYNPNDATWTLSGYHAQFDMDSTLANNITGETFIYGHNNDFVFGALRHVTPQPGALAMLYTSNGHIMEYSFQKSYSVAPNDTTVLIYDGAPNLTIQTCTGSLNEWRTMFEFQFQKVVS